MIFLKKDNKYYIPTKEYFDINTKTFKPTDTEEIINAVNNNYSLDLYNINNEFTIDGAIYYPFDYIDIKKCKLCIIDEKEINKIHVKYNFNTSECKKTLIKLKDKMFLNYNDFLDIETNNKNFISYIVNNDALKTISDIDLDINTINKNFNITFQFNDKDAVLSSIYIKEYKNFVLKKLNKTEYSLTSNLLKTYLTFKNDIDRLYINKIVKHNIQYASDTLKTF